MACANVSEKKHSNYCIIPLIGIPGSGKTTFVKEFSEFLKKSNIKTINVCYDSIVPLDKQKELILTSSEITWKMKRKNILSAVEALIDSNYETNSSVDKVLSVIKKDNVIVKSQKPTVIIIDDNNYYPSMRYEYYQLSKKLQTGFCQFYFQVELKTALLNNDNRDKKLKIAEKVIEKIHSNLVPPDMFKNSWEQFSFAIPIGIEKIEFPFEMCLSLINLAFESPSQPNPDLTAQKEFARSRCNASIIHRSDKVLRRQLNHIMTDEKEAGTEKDQLKIRSKHLNDLRVEVLEDIKTGYKKLPPEVISGFNKKDWDYIHQLDEIICELFHQKIKDND